MKLNAPIVIFILIFCGSESIPFNPWRLVSFIKPKLVNFIHSAMNGTACGADLKRFIDDLVAEKPWAMKMLDANDKFPSGILSGNMRFYGSYDQCLSIRDEINGSTLSGQYCTVYVTLKDNLKKFFQDTVMSITKNTMESVDRNTFGELYHYGLCIPKSCTVTNLTNLWRDLTNIVKFPFQPNFLEESCYHQDKQTTSNAIDVYVFFFFSFIVILELISTGYDIYLQNSEKEPNVFVSFSLYTNYKKLLSTNVQNETLTCLYGVKVISMIWVIFAHISFSKIHVSSSYYAVFKWATSAENSVFLAATYAVDTFFAISGLLVIYVGLSYSNKIKINFFLLYLHRVLRLIPVLLPTILFNITIVKYLLEGPLTHQTIKVLQTNCEKNWWATLSFVNNFVNLQERCVQQSWYLSIDTQLYLLAPLLIYHTKRNPRMTFLGIGLVCGISFIYTWTVVVANKLGFMIYWEVPESLAGYTYFSTLSRMPAWFIGTYFGYIIYQHNFKKIEISKITNFILFIISLSVMIGLILSHVLFLKEEYNVYRSAFFNTFSRPLWSLSVCYIILSCCTGHTGFVNTFLSHPVFVVLGKLTYGMYLTHVAVLYVVGTNRKQVEYFANFTIVFEFWGYFAFTLISAAVLCLVFEAPVVSLLNHLEAHTLKKKE